METANLEALKDETQALADSLQDASGMLTVPTDTFSINARCNSQKLGDSTSKLKARLGKLEQLDNHYQTVKIAATSFNESIFCEGILKLPSINSKFPQIDIRNIEDFEQSILSINQAFIKGTKDLGNRLYARAQVEEITFKSEVCAAEWATFVQQIKANSSIWEDVDKSPNSIFNDGNKVYYISTGGWYMMPFYEEIAEAMWQVAE